MEKLSPEQLLTYIKKQKAKIKQLEEQNESLVKLTEGAKANTQLSNSDIQKRLPDEDNQSRIESLENELAELNTKYFRQEFNFKAALTELEEFKSKFLSVNDQYAQLLSKSHDTQAIVLENESRNLVIETLKSENLNLIDQLKVLNDNYDQQKNEHRISIQKLQSSNALSNDIESNLKTQLLESVATVSKLENDRNQTLQNVNLLETALTDAKQTIETLNKSIQIYEQKYLDEKNFVSTVEEKFSIIKTEFENLKIQHKEKSEKFDNLSADYNQILSTSQSQLKRSAELTNDLETISKERNLAQAAVDRLTTQLEELTTSHEIAINEWKVKLEENQTATYNPGVNDDGNDKAVLIEKETKRNDEANEEIVKLNARINCLDTQLEEYKLKLLEAEVLAQSLTTSATAIDSGVASDKLEDEHAKNVEIIASLERQVSSLTAESVQWKQAEAQQNLRIKELGDTDHSSLDDLVTSLRSQLAYEVETKRAEYAEKIATLEWVNDCVAALEASTAIAAATELHVQALSATSSHLLEEERQRSEELVSNLRNKLAELALATSLRNSADNSNEDGVAESASNTHITELEGVVSALELELKSKTEFIAELEASRATLESECRGHLDKLQNMSVTAVQSSESENQKHEQLMIEKQKIEEALSDCTEALDRMNLRLQESASRTVELEGDLADKEAAIARMMSELNDKASTITSLESEISDALSRVTALELAAKEPQLAEQSAHISSLEQELASATSRCAVLESQSQESLAQVCEYKQKLENSEKERQHMEAASESFINSNKDSVDQLQFTYDQLKQDYEKAVVDKKEAEEKIVAMTDKEKKMKVLIAKYKSLGKERESEFEAASASRVAVLESELLERGNAVARLEAELAESVSRVAKLETELAENKASAKDLTPDLAASSTLAASLEQELATAAVNIAELNAQVCEYKQKIENSENERQRMKAASESFINSNKDCVDQLQSAYDQLKQDFEKAVIEKKEAEEKIVTMSDKEKKMKVLIAKYKSLGQERESEFEKLTAAAAAATSQQKQKVAKRFSIVYMVSAPTPALPFAVASSGSSTTYCLLSVDESGSNSIAHSRSTGDYRYNSPLKQHGSVMSLLTPSSASASTDSLATPDSNGSDNGLRWVEERVVRQWLDSGSSTLLGEWPAETLQATILREPKQRILELQTIVDNLQTEYRDLQSSFEAYKQRAGETLKNLGTLKWQERERQEMEQSKHEKEEISKLMSKYDDLEAQYENLFEEKGQLSEVLSQCQAECVELKQQVATLTAAVDEEKDSNQRLLGKYESLLNSASASNRAAAVSAPLVTHARVVVGDNPVDVSKDMADAAADVNNNDNDDEDDEPLNLNDLDSKPLYLDSAAVAAVVHANTGGSADALNSGSQHHSHISLVGASGNATPTMNTMLQQQHDTDTRDWLGTLRAENTRLNVEILDLKTVISLNNEQLAALKDAIKEMQAAQSRQEEFNPDNKSVNLEYLVNVLKKFLLTDNMSERSRLSQALTQILHMHPDEIKTVSEKWSVQKGPKGLVGWLTTPKKLPLQVGPPQAPATADFNPYADVNGYG